jgi:uncharacterized membrane protein YtjA (UPF0391 family)
MPNRIERPSARIVAHGVVASSTAAQEKWGALYRCSRQPSAHLPYRVELPPRVLKPRSHVKCRLRRLRAKSADLDEWHGFRFTVAKRVALSTQQPESNLRSHPMLYWTVVLLVIALIAAFLGFGGIAASAAGIAKILFFVFLVLAILSFVFGRRAPT